MVQLVYNLCCALRKTLDVKSPRLVGEGPSNREVGEPTLLGNRLAVSIWSFVIFGWIGGHQRSVAWQMGGERSHVGEGCISMETTALCQNPGKDLGTAPGMETPLGVTWGQTAEMGSVTSQWPQAVLLMGYLQGLQSDPSERLFSQGLVLGSSLLLSWEQGRGAHGAVILFLQPV